MSSYATLSRRHLHKKKTTAASYEMTMGERRHRLNLSNLQSGGSEEDNHIRDLLRSLVESQVDENVTTLYLNQKLTNKDIPMNVNLDVETTKGGLDSSDLKDFSQNCLPFVIRLLNQNSTREIKFAYSHRIDENGYIRLHIHFNGVYVKGASLKKLVDRLQANADCAKYIDVQALTQQHLRPPQQQFPRKPGKGYYVTDKVLTHPHTEYLHELEAYDPEMRWEYYYIISKCLMTDDDSVASLNLSEIESVTVQRENGDDAIDDYLNAFRSLNTSYRISQHQRVTNMFRVDDDPSTVKTMLDIKEEISNYLYDDENFRYGFNLKAFELELIKMMNRHFCFISMEGVGTPYIISRAVDHNGVVVITRQSVGGFISSLVGFAFTIPVTKTKRRKVKVSDWWLESDFKTTYRRAVTEPYTDRLCKGDLNLYTGLKYSETEMQEVFRTRERRSKREILIVKTMNRHIYEVICQSNMEKFGFLMTMFAKKVREPGWKPKVAIVVQGPEGVGKSVVFEHYLSVFGRYAYISHNVENVIGQWNQDLAGRLVVYMDEAYWAGKKSLEGVMKALVTQENLTIRRKYCDELVERNSLMVIMSTNNEHCVPAGRQARRWALFKTAEYLRNNDPVEYDERFKRLFDEMDENCLKLWISQFYNEDVFRGRYLKDFGNGHAFIPQSCRDQLDDQKIYNLDSIELFWYTSLRNMHHYNPLIDPLHNTMATQDPLFLYLKGEQLSMLTQARYENKNLNHGRTLHDLENPQFDDYWSCITQQRFPRWKAGCQWLGLVDVNTLYQAYLDFIQNNKIRTQYWDHCNPIRFANKTTQMFGLEPRRTFSVSMNMDYKQRILNRINPQVDETQWSEVPESNSVRTVFLAIGSYDRCKSEFEKRYSLKIDGSIRISEPNEVLVEKGIRCFREIENLETETEEQSQSIFRTYIDDNGVIRVAE